MVEFLFLQECCPLHTGLHRAVKKEYWAVLWLCFYFSEYPRAKILDNQTPGSLSALLPLSWTCVFHFSMCLFCPLFQGECSLSVSLHGSVPLILYSAGCCVELHWLRVDEQCSSNLRFFLLGLDLRGGLLIWERGGGEAWFSFFWFHFSPSPTSFGPR